MTAPTLKHILLTVSTLTGLAVSPAYADDARMKYDTGFGYWAAPTLVAPVCGVAPDGTPELCSNSGSGGSGSTNGRSATDPVYSTPGMLSGVNLSAATADSGTAYTAFGSQACRQLTIANNTGVTIDVQQGGSGVAVPVFNSTYYTFFGLTNANQLGVKRDDSGKTVVTVIARCES